MLYLPDNKTGYPSDHTHMGRQIGKGRVASAYCYVTVSHPSLVTLSRMAP